MGVIVDGQAKVAYAFYAGGLDYVFAWPKKFYYRKRKVRKVQRIGRFPLLQEFGQRARIRDRGQLDTVLGCDGLDAIPSLRSLHYSSY